MKNIGRISTGGLKRSSLLVVGIIVGSMALNGISGMVGAAAKPKTITACANKKTGVMRYSASNKCTKLESTVSLGNSVKNATDLTALSTKTDAFIAAGTKGLGDLATGLTGLAAVATDYEYGVAQLYAGDDPMQLAFVMTPRLDATANMSIATASFPCLAAAPKADGTAVTTGCDVGDKITAKVAVRSLNDVANDKKSTVMCGVNVSQGRGDSDLTTSRWVQTLSSTTGPIVPITRSPLAPVSAADKAVFLVGLKSTDTAVNVTAATNSVNQKYVSQVTQNAITKATTGVEGTNTSGVGGFLAQNTNDMTGATAAYTALVGGLSLLAQIHGAAAAAGTAQSVAGFKKATVAGTYTTVAASFTALSTESTTAAAATTQAAVKAVYETSAATALTAVTAGGAGALQAFKYAVTLGHIAAIAAITTGTTAEKIAAAQAYATAQIAGSTDLATLGTGFATAATATADGTAAIAYATAQATANTDTATPLAASLAALPTSNAGLIQLELRCVAVPKS